MGVVFYFVKILHKLLTYEKKVAIFY